uniref:Uncharacterized protein n=1 Tax=Oryza punctata TaxID=4537 RepID=A0A0E0KF52_ORYPU
MACTASLPPSGGFHRGRRWSNRPGRASSSTSWIEDKARANAAPTHLGGGERRIASPSESWVQDQDKPSSSIAGAGERKVADGDDLPFAGAGEKKRSPSSPDDRFHRGRRWSNRPGRASSSTSWIEDKARANAAPTHLGGGERRIASPSESWVQDQDKPSSSIAGAGERKVADGDDLPFAGAGEKKRSPSSPDDRLEKRARFHHRGDGKNLEEMFAGRWMVRDGVREATGC